jgi:predicted transcriptional regulator
MQYELESLEALSHRLKEMRKTLNISQKKLAKITGLSQSTIARIESDIRKLNPSYLTVFTIADTLNTLGRMSDDGNLLNKKAEDIMHKKIVHVSPNDTIEKAISIIKNYDFPQIPVFDSKGRAVGLVSQRNLLKIATESPDDVSKIMIKEIIESSLPQVDKNVEISKLKPILENFGAVIVIQGTKTVGIITIYDILKLL